ncbi:hypothetical protein SLE2022_067420 [Rubroshorea leprosula]
MVYGENTAAAAAATSPTKSRLRGSLPPPSAVPLSPFWSRSEDKLFEEALVDFPEGYPGRWQKIAERVPGRSPEDVENHYLKLVRDVSDIESGLIDVPDYADDDDWAILSNPDSGHQFPLSKSKNAETERKKGTPWTAEEHKLFLYGLQKYGKGDWRSISRNVVQTRTPTQVASHAQKFFLRQQSGKKERKRSSIHDITMVDPNTVSVQVPAEQVWVPAQPEMQQLPPVSHLPSQGGHLEFDYGYENYGAGDHQNHNFHM